MTAVERDERQHAVPCRLCGIESTWNLNATCDACSAREDEVGARWADEFEAYCRRNDER